MTKSESNALVNRLYKEVDTKHIQYNNSINDVIEKARKDAIQNSSSDFKELVKLIEETGYKSLVRQCVAKMAFSTANIPQRTSEGYYLQEEIRKMLEGIDTKDKNNKQIEEELKQKIVDKYKVVK